MSSIPWPLPHISLLTDQQFDLLRQEPKHRISGTREKAKLGHLEQQYELVATASSERKYRVYIRASAVNEDVFSVGLLLLQPESNILLCRYNSGHHGHKNILEKQKLPPACHQHIATQRYIQAGLDIDGYAVLRSEYSTSVGALELLVSECNIHGILKPNQQTDLFPK
jgi:hypothetical protein